MRPQLQFYSPISKQQSSCTDLNNKMKWVDKVNEKSEERKHYFIKYHRYENDLNIISKYYTFLTNW